jgi:protein SCO1
MTPSTTNSPAASRLSSFERAPARHSSTRFATRILLLATVLLTGCGPASSDDAEPRLDKLWPVPTFQLTNQHGEPFGNAQVAGKTWIATLFFTTCPGPCPMMAARLQEIQAAVADPNVLLVSISCDPENDTVERLAEYAKAHEADPKRWFFLTGAWDDVHRIATDLKLGFDRRDPTTNELTHSTKFLLIDKQGTVRGIYTHDDEASMKQLKEDAKTLAREG